jgi:hypothetical protein
MLSEGARQNHRTTAHAGLVLLAVVAGTIRGRVVSRYTVTQLKLGDARADFGYRARALVAKDPRLIDLDGGVATHVGLDVRTAGGSRLHLEHNLPGASVRIRYLLYANILDAI